MGNFHINREERVQLSISPICYTQNHKILLDITAHFLVHSTTHFGFCSHAVACLYTLDIVQLKMVMLEQ